MSGDPHDNQGETRGTAQSADHGATPAAASGEQLAALMAKAAKDRPDLEAEALRAAEQALLDGQRALANARAQLAGEAQPLNKRELVLRTLLIGNLLLMVAVMFWPVPKIETSTAPQTNTQAPVDPIAQPPAPQGPVIKTDDRWLQALALAENGKYAEALDRLEEYLAEAPRAAGHRLSVYLAMEYYAMKIGDGARASEYSRRAATLSRSSTLPEDLIEMVRGAQQRGDHEAMRSLYARFLLQQRQIPASLYKHVAEAYLKLGDSYRDEAQQATEAARKQELEALRLQMRQAATEAPKEPK